jgi:glycosyltransferase involved in cell wall biosynthesis
MRVTWIIPDTYGFLIDEIEHLVSKVEAIRVLSGMQIPNHVRERLPNVEWHYCPECSFLLAARQCLPLRGLMKTHGLINILRNGWHTRKIAGIYTVLCRLESSHPSTLIHSHFAHPGGLGGTLIPNVPHLLTLRGYDILTTGGYGSLWNPFYRNNLIQTFSENHIITTGSVHSFQRARQILGAEAELRLLQEGIVPGSFTPAGVYSRKSLGIPEDAVALLAVGNLVAVKNHRMLLDALDKLSGRISKPIHLLICGDGPLAKPLRHYADKLGLNECVHFMGRLPRAELTDLYTLADIFVHPSLSEGFGNVILEAMLAKLLVVASPVGIAPDVIRNRENGFLPMLGDKQSLVDALAEAIESLPKMKSALNKNKELALKEFTMSRRIAGYIALYDEIVKNFRSHS